MLFRSPRRGRSPGGASRRRLATGFPQATSDAAAGSRGRVVVEIDVGHSSALERQRRDACGTAEDREGAVRDVAIRVSSSPAISKYRLSPTIVGMSCISASATARSNAGIRSWLKKPRHPPSTKNSAGRSAASRSKPSKPCTTGMSAPSSSCSTRITISSSWK